MTDETSKLEDQQGSLQHEQEANPRLESRVFFFFCNMVVLAGVLNVLINIYQYHYLAQKDPTAIISNLFLVAVGLAFSKIGNSMKRPEILGAVLVVVATTLIAINWPTNQGSQGTLPLWFAPLILFTASMIRGRLLAGVALYLFVVLVGTVGTEALDPQLIQNYVSAEAQLFDKGMVLVVSSAICFVLTFFITIAYRDERDRAVQLAIKNRENEVLLGAALTETGQLRSLLPLCAWCRKIENPDGHWSDLESYLSIQQSTDVTHGMCPDCEKTQGVD